MDLCTETAATGLVFILLARHSPAMVIRLSVPTNFFADISDNTVSLFVHEESTSSRVSAVTVVLPWGAQKETMRSQQIGDMDLRPGEFVMRTLFADFTSQSEKKMEAVMTETVSYNCNHI